MIQVYAGINDCDNNAVAFIVPMKYRKIQHLGKRLQVRFRLRHCGKDIVLLNAEYPVFFFDIINVEEGYL